MGRLIATVPLTLACQGAKGNYDPRPGGTFHINHSTPSMEMNGLDQPGLPYQLGRFVEFLRRRMIYGNHLQWVYGDYTKELETLGEMLGLSVEVFS